MAVDAQIDQLSRQLSMQSLGPIDPVLNEAMFRLSSAVTLLAAWLRQTVYDQPLTMLLLFLSGRLPGGSHRTPLCAPLIW